MKDTPLTGSGGLGSRRLAADLPVAGRKRHAENDRVAAAAPFLSLYLLVLVFFIVLVSISAREEIKSAKVMDSVASTFAPDSGSAALVANLPDVEGQDMAGHMFQKRIASLISERLRLAKVTAVKPGETMQIALPADSMFEPGTINLRAFQESLLDRIVAELSNRPPGLYYEVEFEIGSPYAIGKSLPIGATLEVNRAGAFARRMIALGAPHNAISVALSPGDAQDITLTFHARPRHSDPAGRTGAVTGADANAGAGS